MEHPAIDQLAATPEILRLIMAGLTDEQAQRKAAPDRWSVAEIVEHLSHTEGHVFRERIDRMIAEDKPEFQDYDTREYDRAGAYSNRGAEESFAHWEEQREDNVRLLAELEPAMLERRGVHSAHGEITLAQVLNAWAYHDLGHVRQITEIVRTLVYYPGMGPFASEYTPKP